MNSPTPDTFDTPLIPPASRRELVTGIITLAAIFGVMVIGMRLINFENLQERVLAAGALGPLIVIILKASTLVFAPLGGSPLYPISGALFGFWNGFLYIFLGDLVGSTISFYISRWFGTRVVRFFVSKKGMPIVERVLAHLGTVKGLIQARIMFVALPEAVSYAAGLTRISFLTFLPIHLAVGIPVSALLVLAGDFLGGSGTSLGFVAVGLMGTFAMLAGFFMFYKTMGSRSGEKVGEE